MKGHQVAIGGFRLPLSHSHTVHAAPLHHSAPPGSGENKTRNSSSKRWQVGMVVALASPSPAAPSGGRPHPTYKEALTELQDPSGLSRRAIAKYIADHFSGLHSSHEALLSVHLRRLNSQGQLRLVSGNYFLSTEASPPGQKRGRGRPPKPKAAPAPGPKRGRGRPRKNPDLAPSAPIPSFQGPKRGPGRPRKNALVPVASSASPLLGAIAAPPPPSGVKRGRGRPRKNALVLVASSDSALPGAIAPPPPSGVKRGRGRPRKNAPVPMVSSASPLPGAIALPASSGTKRGPGRPRKNALALVPFSSSQLARAIAPPPPYGVKRGRGRPQKNALALVPSSSSPLPRAIAPSPPSGIKRGRGRPRKNPYPVASKLLGVVSVSSTSVVGVKRGRGRPPKLEVTGERKRGRPSEQKMHTESLQFVDAALTKRGPGRPRKEKPLESGDLRAAQMTEGQHEALPAQDASQAGVVQNEVEARSLQSRGSSLTEKTGRGRPRKRPLEAETAETGVAALVVKRGRGRPRKKNPSAGRSTATGLTSSSRIKRGPGRPRKVRPYESGFGGTSVEVSRDLTERRSEKDEDLASEMKGETQGAIFVEAIDTQPADAGYVLVSRGEAANAPVDAIGAMPSVVLGKDASIAPMDAGVAMPGVVSGEDSAFAPMDAGAAMPGVDPIDSNVGTNSH
ncbi:hypothetical protein HU200_057446 [Digitaria exilis]|uniref:H15 domain-containing protein n=1 Tax=Digitaria exilis TaxID=1010633 RepID=A0A835E2W7_9POAL|nr:hypothetical protein HU200_057446 [Digitaria exilis]